MGALVALLATDIVDSTRLWRVHEAEMAVDLERHDEVVHRVVGSLGGRIFKHTGDGALAAFDDARAAVTAAVEIQRSIAAEAWNVPGGLRIRSAVDAGAVHPRGDDLFGTPVNRVARLLGAGAPGAVLVSGVVEQLVTDDPAITLVRVGEVTLRGFAKPVAVSAVAADHLQVPGPAQTEASDDRHVLPVIGDDLVGRTAELARAWDALAVHRLVTLVGVGGMGKTRLALELAAGMVPSLADGAWWCDLTAATSDESVAPVVLDAIGATQVAERAAQQGVADSLRHRQGLLVLDNCEHVRDSTRALAELVLATCPSVVILATSREALEAGGEHLVPVTSLPPDDAAELFRRRAVALRPELDLAAETGVVGRICHELDGIPLAIELAAARCRSMSPVEIEQRLDDRFRLLRGGRARAERHRTLQAAVAWSYDLLEPDEQAVFDALAVFVDGSLLDGISAVTGLDEYDALDLVDRLVGRSMVVATPMPVGTRYRQLETIRQFAEDRLLASGRLDEARDRHLEWVRSLAATMDGTHASARTGADMLRFAAEVSNVRVAVSHAQRSARPHVAHEIVANTGRLILARPALEVIGWFDPADDGDAMQTDHGAAALAVVAITCLFAGVVDRPRHLAEMYPLERRSDPYVVMALAFHHLFDRGDLDAARAVLDEAPPSLTAQNMANVELIIENVRLQWGLDDDTTARLAELARRRVVESAAAGDLVLHGFVLDNASLVLTNAGRPADGLAAALEAEALAIPIGAGLIVDAARAGASWARSKGADPHDVGSRSHLRAALVDMVERGNFFSAHTLLGPVSIALSHTDLPTAYLLDRVARRITAFPILLPEDPYDQLAPDEREALEELAADLSIEDACARALVALSDG